MVELVRTSGKFGVIQRNVRVDVGWPGDSPPAARLAGPVVVDVYHELLSTGEDELITRLVDEAQVAGIMLGGWSDEHQRAFRSSAWRSAHRFIAQNVDLVDRGPELEELTRLLRVVR